MATTKEKPQETEDFSIESMLDSTREQYVAQMEALRPQHEAFLKLEAIVSNFDRIASGDLGRKRGTAGTAERAARGSRPQQFLDAVRSAGEEGITVAEIAESMDVTNSNYLYRIAHDLTAQGTIRKDADTKKYFFVESDEEPVTDADEKK